MRILPKCRLCCRLRSTPYFHSGGSAFLCLRRRFGERYDRCPRWARLTQNTLPFLLSLPVEDSVVSDPHCPTFAPSTGLGRRVRRETFGPQFLLGQSSPKLRRM